VASGALETTVVLSGPVDLDLRRLDADPIDTKCEKEMYVCLWNGNKEWERGFIASKGREEEFPKQKKNQTCLLCNSVILDCDSLSGGRRIPYLRHKGDTTSFPFLSFVQKTIGKKRKKYHFFFHTIFISKKRKENMLSRVLSHSLMGASLVRSLAQVVHITDENFKEVVLDSKKPVIVDFFAEWCGPCKMLGPLIEAEALKSGDDIVVAKIDVDGNPQSAMESMVRVHGFTTNAPLKDISCAVPSSNIIVHCIHTHICT
jgi:thiol-disulfide isomerase/thioredoxin